MSKKEQVKDYIRQNISEEVTVNQLYWILTGIDGRYGGVRWHKPVLDVSHSTVRRALNEVVADGELQSYYACGGHCFDELWYKKVSE